MTVRIALFLFVSVLSVCTLSTANAAAQNAEDSLSDCLILAGDYALCALIEEVVTDAEADDIYFEEALPPEDDTNAYPLEEDEYWGAAHGSTSEMIDSDTTIESSPDPAVPYDYQDYYYQVEMFDYPSY